MLNFTNRNRGRLSVMSDTDNWDLIMDGSDQVNPPNDDDFDCLDNLLGDDYDIDYV